MDEVNNYPKKMFNSQFYRFEIKILPYEGDEITLNPDALIQLVIEDDMFFWPKRGFIVFQNGFDTFEGAVDTEVLDGLLDAKQIQIYKDKNKQGFIFRNDGKDRISIKVKPIIAIPDADLANANDALEEPNDRGWLINISANIYDKEDPMVNKLTDKIKKLYFWDERYQKMLERNLEWSTATSKLNPNSYKNPYTLKDSERTLLTGEAIKDILVNNMGYTIDEDNFDKGSTKVFHNSPSDYNVWDNIDYLLSNHASEKKLKSENSDICIFTYDNFTDKFQLMPLQNILNKAGNDVNNPKEYQIEHLFLEDMAEMDTGSSAGSVWMAPFLDKLDMNKDVKMCKIKKYSFVDMAGIDSVNSIITTASHTYDSRTKTFIKNCRQSQIANIPNQIKNDYIQPYMLGGKGGASPYLNLNLNKIKNKKVANYYTPVPNKNVLNKLSYGKLVNKSFFLNQSILLELEGSTNRKIARFVGIDRLINNNTNEFNGKLCGQWLITYVKHNFYKNSYINELICIKPHTYEKINIREDIE